MAFFSIPIFRHVFWVGGGVGSARGPRIIIQEDSDARSQISHDFENQYSRMFCHRMIIVDNKQQENILKISIFWKAHQLLLNRDDFAINML